MQQQFSSKLSECETKKSSFLFSKKKREKKEGAGTQITRLTWRRTGISLSLPLLQDSNLNRK